MAHYVVDPLQKSAGWMFGAHCTLCGPGQYTQGLSGHKDHGSLPRPRKSLIRNAPTSSRPRHGTTLRDSLAESSFKVFTTFRLASKSNRNGASPSVNILHVIGLDCLKREKVQSRPKREHDCL